MCSRRRTWLKIAPVNIVYEKMQGAHSLPGSWTAVASAETGQPSGDGGDENEFSGTRLGPGRPPVPRPRFSPFRQGSDQPAAPTRREAAASGATRNTEYFGIETPSMGGMPPGGLPLVPALAPSPDPSQLGAPGPAAWASMAVPGVRGRDSARPAVLRDGVSAAGDALPVECHAAAGSSRCSSRCPRCKRPCVTACQPPQDHLLDSWS